MWPVNAEVAPQGFTTPPPSSDLHAIVQIDHVDIAHADAAGRDVVPDRPWLVRAVNAIKRIAEIHRARAERIRRPARHEMRQIAALVHDAEGRNLTCGAAELASAMESMEKACLACSSSAISRIFARIEKVIGLLTGLDEHLSGFASPPVLSPATRGLINGPRLDGGSGHVVQDEIDALFG
jgi:hypothetical protein